MAPGKTAKKRAVRRDAAAAAEPRVDNRREVLLGAAARLFAKHGFEATSMRDIASEVGMLAGSMYYHFPSKEVLVAATHGQGVQEVTEAVAQAIAGIADPWQRLEAACVAQLQALLGGSDFAAVVRQEFSRVSPSLRKQLIAQRDQYENLFGSLIADLPLPANVDRRMLRLMLLGALNATPVWYRPGGETPGSIARRFVALIRCGPSA